MACQWHFHFPAAVLFVPQFFVYLGIIVGIKVFRKFVRHRQQHGGIIAMQLCALG